MLERGRHVLMNWKYGSKIHGGYVLRLASPGYGSTDMIHVIISLCA